MIELNLYLPDTAATLRLGYCLAQLSPLPSVIALDGDLGAGKTHLSQGLAVALGIAERLTSPTFTLVNEYEVPSGISLFHFDWYRLGSLDELYDLGWEDYLATPSLCLVEWASRFPDALPTDTLHIHLAHQRPGRTARLLIPDAYVMLGALIAQEFPSDG